MDPDFKRGLLDAEYFRLDDDGNHGLRAQRSEFAAVGSVVPGGTRITRCPFGTVETSGSGNRGAPSGPK